MVDKSVGLVIPAYRPDIDQLNRYIDALRDNSVADVIHVELDSPTTSLSDDISADSIHVSSARRGKGAAITDGFNRLTTDIVAYADADGSVPASSLEKIITTVVNDSTTLAVGSRRHPEATVEDHQSVIRRRMGDAFAWLARRILPVKLYDYQCGAKALTSQSWETVSHRMYESGFAWDVELVTLVATSGNEIKEIPVRWSDDPESTVSPISAAVTMLLALFLLRYRVSTTERNRFYSIIHSLRYSESNPKENG